MPWAQMMDSPSSRENKPSYSSTTPHNLDNIFEATRTPPSPTSVTEYNTDIKTYQTSNPTSSKPYTTTTKTRNLMSCLFKRSGSSSYSSSSNILQHLMNKFIVYYCVFHLLLLLPTTIPSYPIDNNFHNTNDTLLQHQQQQSLMQAIQISNHEASSLHYGSLHIIYTLFPATIMSNLNRGLSLSASPSYNFQYNTRSSIFAAAQLSSKIEEIASVSVTDINSQLPLSDFTRYSEFVSSSAWTFATGNAIYSYERDPNLVTVRQSWAGTDLRIRAYSIDQSTGVCLALWQSTTDNSVTFSSIATKTGWTVSNVSIPAIPSGSIVASTPTPTAGFWLATANLTDGYQLNVYQYGSLNLTPLPVSVPSTAGAKISLAFDEVNNYLYLSNGSHIYVIDPSDTDNFTLVGGNPPYYMNLTDGSEIKHLAVTPLKNALFVVTNEMFWRFDAPNVTFPTNPLTPTANVSLPSYSGFLSWRVYRTASMIDTSYFIYALDPSNIMVRRVLHDANLSTFSTANFNFVRSEAIGISSDSSNIWMFSPNTKSQGNVHFIRTFNCNATSNTTNLSSCGTCVRFDRTYCKWCIDTAACDTKCLRETPVCPQALDIFPKNGSSSGKFSLTVVGTNFINRTDYTGSVGKIGGNKVTWLNSTTVRINEMPPSPFTGNISIIIQLNNYNYTEQEMIFEYIGGDDTNPPTDTATDTTNTVTDTDVPTTTSNDTISTNTQTFVPPSTTKNNSGLDISKNKSVAGIVAGVSVAGVLCCCIAAALAIILVKQRKNRKKKEKIEMEEMKSNGGGRNSQGNTPNGGSLSGNGIYLPRSGVLSQDTITISVGHNDSSGGSEGNHSGGSFGLGLDSPHHIYTINRQQSTSYAFTNNGGLPSGKHASMFDASPSATKRNVKYMLQYEELIISDKIGQGAYGSVWKGYWRSSPVAVKMIKSDLTISQQALAEFLKEARLMKELQPHRNVVQFLGVCEDPLCIVTEFCKNGSLYALLHGQESMDLELKLSILLDVSAGMHHLSQENIVHRDLAARNVLLSDSFVAKVSDFGLSRLSHDDGGIYSAAEMGPLKWMAPESLMQKKFSTKSDVWSFGVLCIEVLTRKDPYYEMTTAEFAIRLLPEKLSLVPYIPKETPEFLKSLIVLCFAPKPEDRPSFEEICSVLLHNHRNGAKTTMARPPSYYQSGSNESNQTNNNNKTGAAAATAPNNNNEDYGKTPGSRGSMAPYEQFTEGFIVRDEGDFEESTSIANYSPRDRIYDSMSSATSSPTILTPREDFSPRSDRSGEGPSSIQPQTEENTNSPTEGVDTKNVTADEEEKPPEMENNNSPNPVHKSE